MRNIFLKNTTDHIKEDYRSLLLALNQTALVSETDNQGNIIYVNDKFVEVAKYSREELLGQNHRILKSGHQEDELFVGLWQTISSGRVWRGEIKNRAKDGSYYWVDTSIAPVLDSSGKPDRYVSVRFLISDKKAIQQGLAEQSRQIADSQKAVLNVLEDTDKEKKYAESLAHELEKFKIALDGTSDHVIITDPNGTILYANASLERITGFRPDEVIGRKAGTRELWGGNMEQEFYEKLWHTIKIKKKPFTGELTNKRKNGVTYQALSTISPILTKRGKLEFFVGIERDVTKEREIDRAKSEFVSLASHQLRTPLTGIEWTTELFLRKEKLTKEGKKYLQDIRFSARRLGTLVKLLLNVSRIESGRVGVAPEPVELVEYIKNYAQECQALIEKKKLVFIFAKHPKKLVAATDKNVFGYILQNILNNAIEYTPKGGTVEIRLEAKGDSALLAISDTGIGIPKKEQERIFEKFFRAPNAVVAKPDGTGLGLYIAKEAAELLGGKIWCESKEGKGATFYVEFFLEAKPLKGEAMLESDNAIH